MGEFFYLRDGEMDIIASIQEYTDPDRNTRSMLREILGRDEDPKIFAKRAEHFKQLLEQLKTDKSIIRALSDEHRITIEEGIEEVILPILRESRSAISSIDNAADSHALEEMVAFIRHAGELLMEFCDHPEVNIPLQDKVRREIIGDSPEAGVTQ